MASELSSKFEDRSILVTGATGFLGIHLARRLIESRARVHLIARGERQSEILTELEEFSDGFFPITVHFADISDFDRVREIVKTVSPSKVFHLASKVDPSRDFKIAEECLKTNARGTFNILEALSAGKIDSFLLASTTEVYGNNPTPFKENQKPDPPSPYAISKVAAEHFCGYFYRTRNVPVTVLRMSSCYGPCQRKPRLIPSVFAACFSPNEVLNLTSGKQKRDFLYVQDAIDGLLRASLSPKAVGETINLAGNKSYSVKEVVDTICSLSKTRPNVRWNSYPHRPNENKTWKTDTKKAKKILNWTAKTSLIEGLQATYQWWLEQNPNADEAKTVSAR